MTYKHIIWLYIIISDVLQSFSTCSCGITSFVYVFFFTCALWLNLVLLGVSSLYLSLVTTKEQQPPTDHNYVLTKWSAAYLYINARPVCFFGYIWRLISPRTEFMQAQRDRLITWLYLQFICKMSSLSFYSVPRLEFISIQCYLQTCVNIDR